MGETKKGESKKKQYQKPAIVFAKKIEIISGTCSSSWNGTGVCRLSQPQCVKTRT